MSNQTSASSDINAQTDQQSDGSPAPNSTADAPKGSIKESVDRFIGQLLLRSILLLVTAAALLDLYEWRYGKLNIFEPRGTVEKPLPLAMEGGDPYIRALMRTISASESNVPRPYSVIYGGDYFESWNSHPDDCVYIPVGPNTGNCSTAAGRYQFITTTWETQAQKYHPEQPKLLFWRPYRFDPVSQDVVVHRWLSNPNEWGTDLAYLLRLGEVSQVLEILSPTWTSLGYGIETNSMSAYLPEIYVEMLDEEIALLTPEGEATQVQPATAGQPSEQVPARPLEQPFGEPLSTQAEDWQVRDESGQGGITAEDGAIAGDEAVDDSDDDGVMTRDGETADQDGAALADPYSRSTTLRDGVAEIGSGAKKLLEGLIRR